MLATAQTQAANRCTFKTLRFFSACHRSYCICWFNQLSALVSKAMDRRIAISGLIPARPLRMADKVLRLTPRLSAAAVTEIPSGSRQSSRRKESFLEIYQSPSLAAIQSVIAGTVEEFHSPESLSSA